MLATRPATVATRAAAIGARVAMVIGSARVISMARVTTAHVLEGLYRITRDAPAATRC